ncbi:M23 family metallopeptidase [Rhodohalobacter mucosus]|uniref:M23ase beta-sheet core domain-containing protein n=1 Tax=Rhodohalobacter mucosus TaxID=2079485 RepID=A0A316U0P6_9BACT|nr:M23 family metallopeptidase [Rhodohalobacter mucosus]PWN06296.1 hypothetical protein DDZ15_10760 [Rhodohalobacter mucosus]
MDMKQILTFSTWILCSIMLSGLSHSANAQHRPIEVTYEANNRDGYSFYAINRTPIPMIVTIGFSDLRNLDASEALPFSRNVSGARVRLLTLSKQWSDQQSHFRYSTRYHSGCLDTDPDDVEYLLPFREGTFARASELSYLGEMVNREAPDDWYSISFRTENETEIYSARKGVVVDVQDGENDPGSNLLYTSNRNTVTVVHEDCTFARYSVFRDDEIYVSEGETVYPGQPLGKMAGDEFELGNQIRMLVYYRNDDSVVFNPADADGVSNWRYIKPVFRTTQNRSLHVTSNELYESVHPEEVITSEMSRRERRKWSRSN